MNQPSPQSPDRRPASLAELAAPGSQVSSRAELPAMLGQRYADARAILVIGRTVEGIALLILLIIFVTNVVLFRGLNQFSGTLCILFGWSVAIPAFALGVWIADRGRGELAALDAVVNKGGQPREGEGKGSEPWSLSSPRSFPPRSS